MATSTTTTPKHRLTHSTGSYPKPHFSNSQGDESHWQLPQLQSREAQHRCGPHRECILIFTSWNAICGHRHICALEEAYIDLLWTRDLPFSPSQPTGAVCSGTRLLSGDDKHLSAACCLRELDRRSRGPVERGR